jgi:hypothetical protein
MPQQWIGCRGAAPTELHHSIIDTRWFIVLIVVQQHAKLRRCRVDRDVTIIGSDQLVQELSFGGQRFGSSVHDHHMPSSAPRHEMIVLSSHAMTASRACVATIVHRRRSSLISTAMSPGSHVALTVPWPSSGHASYSSS